MITRRIYVASSWRNTYQAEVVQTLRAQMHAVYDFKNPPTQSGFHWSAIDKAWEEWNPAQFRNALKSPIAKKGFESDKTAMDWADTCVLVLPSGRSAHMEAAFMAAEEKRVIVYMPEKVEPELMYGLLFPVSKIPGQLIAQHRIALDMAELLKLVTVNDYVD